MESYCSTCGDPVRSGALCYFCTCKESDDVMIYLRGSIKRWVKDSQSYWGNRCIVTGERSEVVHHVTNFAFIVSDALDELRKPKKPVSWYTKEELSDLENLVLIKHYEAGLGVCLTKKLHDAYHKEYGKKDNNAAQFRAWLKGVKANGFRGNNNTL